MCFDFPRRFLSFFGESGEDIEKIAAQSNANRNLREALQADTASAQAKMQAVYGQFFHVFP